MSPPIRLSLIAVLFIAASACNSPRPSGSAETAEPELASDLFDRFPSRSYESFQLAESAAGYHIPRPGLGFSPAFGQTNLQWSPNIRTPISRTEYTIPSMAPESIQVRVAPSAVLGGGGAGMMQGASMTIDEKRGWFTDDDDVFLFNYSCGATGTDSLWCTVRAPIELGRGQFEEFVASVK